MDKHIRISAGSHAHLKKLAKRHGKSIKELTEQMINYFRRTDIDPSDVSFKSSADAIKSLDKRLIGFIKTQEKEKLNPLLDEVSIAVAKLNAMTGSKGVQNIKNEPEDFHKEQLKYLKAIYGRTDFLYKKMRGDDTK